ncbi:MAG: translation elongation factor Ts [Coxiellaceae bacterium]|jgi:elongation factor Ts|nr:translation elongation factor Ts [Coxiellaceae bacterium]
MTINTSLIKELREATGAGMMECKKALEEAEGNLETALTIIRKAGHAKAARKVNRIACEGIITIKTSPDHKKAIMIEINCETDFAAKDHSFLEFVDTIANQSLNEQIMDLKSFIALPSVAEMQENLIAKIGENVTIRRLKMMVIDGEGMISNYLHGNRIGVLVKLSLANAELGKDLAMHIAACSPIAIGPESLPQTLIDKEKEIYFAQLQNSNKSQEVLAKIVAGRIQKFINESVLVKQPFVKNPELLVEDLLQKFHLHIIDFTRFEVGEGIEKKMTDFVSEVEAQIKTKKDL